MARALRWLLIGVAVLLPVAQGGASDLTRTILVAVNEVQATGSAPALSNFTFDGPTDAAEYIFQCPKSLTITTGKFRYGARVGTPPTYKLSLQGVDGNGRADGAIKDDNGPAPNDTSITFTPPADTTWDGTLRTLTFDVTYGCDPGEFVALVIAYSSGTLDTSNGSTFTTHVTNSTSALPYAVRVDGGSGTKQTGAPIYGYGDGSAVYGFPVETMTATQFSSDSTPDERGNAITIPAGMCASFKIAGIRMFPRIPATGKTVLVSLYSNTTALQTVTWDSDVAGAAATTENTPIRILFDETTLSTLTCGTEYIVAVAPQETSSNLAVRWFTFDAANDVTALPLGTAWYAVSRADAGSWTTDTSSRYTIDLILSDVTEPTGGSTPRVLGSN